MRSQGMDVLAGSFLAEQDQMENDSIQSVDGVDNGRKPLRTVLLIAFAIAMAYLFMTTRSTLWDRDEGYYSRVTMEMLESGDYIVPFFNGSPWLEKPILIYWLMSLPVRFVGPAEYAFRFFSVMGTALTCLFTFLIARRLVDARSAFMAMLVLPSTLMMLVVGTSAIPDAVLLPFAVYAMLVFVEAMQTGTRARHVVLMGLAFGLGMLAKGPIGVLPVPAILLTLWLSRRQVPRLPKQLFNTALALALGALIFLLWIIPANKATDGEFFRIFFGQHVFGRALKPMQHHGGEFLLSLPYYIPVLIGGFFPWSLYLPGTFSALLGRRIGGPRARALLISWIASTFVLMTLAATKLPHYIAFIWPALAIATAATITAAQENRLEPRDLRWLRRGVWFYAPFVFIGVGGFIIVPVMLKAPLTFIIWCLLCAAVLAVMGIVTVRRHLAAGAAASWRVLLIGMILFQVPFLLGVLPGIERIKIPPAIGKAVRQKVSGDTPVAVYEYFQPSLVFYLDRNVERLRNEQDVVEWAGRPEQGALIVPSEVFEKLHKEYNLVGLEQIALKEGYNYTKGEALTIVAIRRKID